MNSGRGKKAPVAFTKPADPTFLRKLKEQIGFKESASIDTKVNTVDFEECRRQSSDQRRTEYRREVLPPSDSDDHFGDDERPTVVVLSDGDLTQNEANQIFENDPDSMACLDPDETGDSRVLFKKSTKRKADQTHQKTDLEKKKAHGATEKVKNKSLLSFDDEEDDDSA